jgi:hypothetical protein
MNRSFPLVLGLLSLLFFVSCQKETSFEVGLPARGSLQNTAGDCAPKTLKGIYKATQALTDSNTLDVTVNVAQTGNYTIYTDTINGYFFRGTGNFSATGTNTVRLKGSGTPAIAGTNDFTVFFDSSFCSVPVTVLPSGSTSGGSAVFTLQNSPNACMFSNLVGTYTQGTALTSANKVDIQVNVSTPGTWTISTTTVTGFSFSGSGTFTTTGVQTITLNGSGTPTATGAQTFSLSAGTTSCTFPVTVNPNTAPQAVYTLVGGPGTCSSFTPSGTYTQGTALGSGNTVLIQVNVTTPGQWSATTTTVTGMSFAGAGTFTTGGNQTITLTGTGTPTTAGVQTFSLTAGGNTCTFTITVTASTSTSANEYFPLAVNSYWTYDDGTAGSDTMKTVSAPTTSTFGSNTYRNFINSYESFSDDTSFYRKDNTTGFYYNYLPADLFAASGLTFTQGLDVLFLKNTLTTGATWNSDHLGTFSGLPTTLRFKYTCANANTTVTVNGKTFTNVYKVTLQIQIGIAGTYTDNGGPIDFYYAKGIGQVKIGDPTNGDLDIRYYQVF